MKGHVFWVGLLLVAGGVAGEELTLERAVELAVGGPTVQAAELVVRASQAKVGEIRALRLPQVDLEAQARGLRKDPGFLVPRGAFGNPVPLPLVTGEREIQTGRLTVSQLLWDWQRTGLAVAAAQAQAAAQDSQRESLRVQIAKAAVEAFARAWEAQGALTACQQAQAAAVETLRVVQAMVTQGLLPRSDQLAAEFVVARREAELAAAEAARAAALAVLRELTGVEVSGVVLDTEKLAAARVNLEARSHRAELQALRLQKEALEKGALVSRRENWPVVVAVGGVEHVRDHFYLHQTNSFAAVLLQAHLFDGGEASSRFKALSLEAEATTRKLEAASRAVERELRVALAKEEAAVKALAAAEKAMAFAEEEVRLETLRHSQGLATTRDLLAAQEHLAQARAAVAQGQAAWLSALAEKAAACGDDLLRVFGGER